MVRRRRKKEPRKQSYKLYIRRVLRDVHVDKEISIRTLNIMNSFVNDAFDRIASEATRIAHYDRRKTVTLRDMEYAVRLVLPDGMAKTGNQGASKVMTKFYASRVRDRMRRTEARRADFQLPMVQA
uniref:Histone H2A/H2B/H3 domain-containing protein n=1 Tax=Globodera rostochiensis TaxID=31243 RepID=A0A914HWX0_GLORO